MRRRRSVDPTWPLYRAPRGAQLPEHLKAGLPESGFVVLALGGETDGDLISFIERMAGRRGCRTVVMADRLDAGEPWLADHEVVALNRDLVEFVVPRHAGAVVLLLEDGCIADAAAGPVRLAAPLRDEVPQRRAAVPHERIAVGEQQVIEVQAL